MDLSSKNMLNLTLLYGEPLTKQSHVSIALRKVALEMSVKEKSVDTVVSIHSKTIPRTKSPFCQPNVFQFWTIENFVVIV